MVSKRPIGVLRYNIKVMRDNGAPREAIEKYLNDNGSDWGILNAPVPNQKQLQGMLNKEKDGSYAEYYNKMRESEEKVKKYERNIERLGVAQGAVRGWADGLMFGFGDELENLATGQDLDSIRAEKKQFAREHPVLSIGSNIAGTVANPFTRAFGVSKGASLGTKVLNGAAQGAGFGALYGLGSGEGGLENRLKSAGNSAVTGGIIGGSVPLAVEGVKAVGRGIADVAGLSSGAGGASLKRAYDAGTRNSKTFTDAMRGKSSVYDVVDDVDRAVRTMEQNASNKYRAMLPKDGSKLKLSDKEFNAALKAATKSISGVTAGVDDTAANAINKVHKLADNIKYSGGMTFDNALEAKKAIDGIIEPLARSGEKNSVRLLTPIKNALNETLEGAVPEYGGARAAFRSDMRMIDNIKNALTSKNPTAELTKLQGITRQSVAAAQGGKQELGRVLDEISGGKILDAVAGGQVQQWVPRDPVRALAAGGAAFSTSGLSSNPVGVLTLPAFSPRASGEIAYKLGQAAKYMPNNNTAAAVELYDALQKR